MTELKGNACAFISNMTFIIITFLSVKFKIFHGSTDSERTGQVVPYLVVAAATCCLSGLKNDF